MSSVNLSKSGLIVSGLKTLTGIALSSLVPLSSLPNASAAEPGLMRR